ncbi:hypothetical protein BDV97DRAFT_423767 [Delphinella strobiligena]|nr:hypothetical protein BDV97DRAFT_423767 [Delphinella strobiligena]
MIVDCGDEVVVRVSQYLQFNSTTIRWQEIRQLNNNENDCVPAIIQYPIAQREAYTYSRCAQGHRYAVPEVCGYLSMNVDEFISSQRLH